MATPRSPADGDEAPLLFPDNQVPFKVTKLPVKCPDNQLPLHDAPEQLYEGGVTVADATLELASANCCVSGRSLTTPTAADIGSVPPPPPPLADLEG